MWHRILQIRLLMGLLPALGLVLWAGIDDGSTYYEKSPAEVQKLLKSAHVPTHVLGSYVAGSRVHTPDDTTIITALIDREGRELMHFVTKVEPDGTGVNVKTSVEAPDGEFAEKAEQKLEENAFTAGLLSKLAQEHVAAAIEERPFDLMFAAAPGTKQIMGNIPGMQQTQDISSFHGNKGFKETWSNDSDDRDAESYEESWDDDNDGWGDDDDGWDD